jgi:hypothetical protein
MNQRIITNAKIKELLKFLPLFDDPNRDFIKEWEDPIKKSGTFTFTIPVYCDDVKEFFKLAAQKCWADFDYVSKHAGDMVNDEKFIEQADIQAIKTMITWCVRGERFCTGHRKALLESGKIVSILKRLKKLSTSPDNSLVLETTRKKSLEIMHKGMISYKLANLGWDVSEHLGDGYDLLGMTTQTGTQLVAKIELKAVDRHSYLGKASFSQAVSENEISTATHLIISIFNGIEPEGHFIMSLEQAFNAVKVKATKKFAQYKDFHTFQKATMEISQKKILLKKGNKEKLIRLALDIGCTFKKFNEDKWELGIFKDRWDNLLQ